MSCQICEDRPVYIGSSSRNCKERLNQHFYNVWIFIFQKKGNATVTFFIGSPRGSERYPGFGSVRVTSTLRKIGCKIELSRYIIPLIDVSGSVY